MSLGERIRNRRFVIDGRACRAKHQLVSRERTFWQRNKRHWRYPLFLGLFHVQWRGPEW